MTVDVFPMPNVMNNHLPFILIDAVYHEVIADAYSI